jgi:hypothetical protein
MHLLVLRAGYTSPRNAAFLRSAPRDRVACVDVNVSNLSVVSVCESDSRDVRSTVVRASATERDRLAALAAKNRRGARPVERSRRSSNAIQYAKSRTQLVRDERRKSRGLREVTTTTPGGGRLSRADGTPLRAYRRDDLSDAYRDNRRRQGEQTRAESLTKQTRAHEVAVQLVTTHGVHWLIEDCNLTAWAKLWGKSLHAFAPGMVTVELAALSARRRRLLEDGDRADGALESLPVREARQEGSVHSQPRVRRVRVLRRPGPGLGRPRHLRRAYRRRRTHQRPRGLLEGRGAARHGLLTNTSSPRAPRCPDESNAPSGATTSN